MRFEAEREVMFTVDRKSTLVVEIPNVLTADECAALIAKIDDALRRIEEGTYGYCVETDEPIGVKRLEARPIATLSLEAQERHERMERTHRDD